MSLTITRDPEVAKQRVLSIAKKFCIRPLVSELNLASSLEDLLRLLPVASKDDLASYGQNAALDLFENGLLFSETSGTTSVPLQTPRGMRDLKWNTLNQLYAYKRCLQPSVDRVAILHPSVLSPFVEASACALQDLGVGYLRVYPIPNVCEYDRIFDVFERYGITTIMSTPTLVYKLLYEFRRLGRGVLPKCLKRLLLTGEYLSPGSVLNLQQILGSGSAAMPFVYGSSEAATLMYGMPDGTYRAIPEDFVYEVASVDDNPCTTASKPGIFSGKLIVTWLRDGLLPIVRYDTNDIFTVWREQPTGEYIFRFDGRERIYPISSNHLFELEEGIYSLDVPVFYFECRAEAKARHLQILIVSEPGAEITTLEVSGKLRSRLELPWDFSVVVNPRYHRFYQFSPTSKTNRFITC